MYLIKQDNIHISFNNKQLSCNNKHIIDIILYDILADARQQICNLKRCRKFLKR